MEGIIKSTVKQEIKNLVTSVSDINKKLGEIEGAQQFQSEQYDSFRNQIGHVLRINTELKNENEKLNLRIRDLERKDQQHTKAIDDLEQYGRREMLEIGGIPRNNGENCEEIVIELAKKLNVNLVSSDIEACHRISPKENASIIAKFQSRKTREALLSKEAKSLNRELKISNLGYQMAGGSCSDKNGKIFLNESLTSRNNNLLLLTKIKKRDLNYKFFWTRNGVMFARKDESAPIHKINFERDLEKYRLFFLQVFIFLRQLVNFLTPPPLVGKYV